MSGLAAKTADELRTEYLGDMPSQLCSIEREVLQWEANLDLEGGIPTASGQSKIIKLLHRDIRKSKECHYKQYAREFECQSCAEEGAQLLMLYRDGERTCETLQRTINSNKTCIRGCIDHPDASSLTKTDLASVRSQIIDFESKSEALPADMTAQMLSDLGEKLEGDFSELLSRLPDPMEVECKTCRTVALASIFLMRRELARVKAARDGSDASIQEWARSVS